MKPRNGIWMSDFRLSNGERVRVSLKTRDKTEAKGRELQLQAKMERELTSGPQEGPKEASPSPTVPRSDLSGITFGKAFRRAMKEYEPWRSSTSPTTLESNYGRMLEKFKEDMDISLFTRALMLEYVEELREDEVSASTINQRLSLVSVILKCAEDWTEGKVEPFKMPRQKVRKGRIRILDYKEEKRVTDWFRSPERTRRYSKDMADLVEFLVDTGFRLSEAIKLKIREVHWESNRVPAWETKADHPRLIPMTDRVRAILESRRKLEEPFGMLTKDSADDYWDGMRRDLRINRQEDPEFVIHALRHTCASRLAASGVDAFKIQKWMGHKSIATTQKYITLFANDLDSLAGTLEERRSNLAPQKSVQSVPKSVPKKVQYGSWLAPPGVIQVGHKALNLKGIDRSTEPIPPVDGGLLIRRSLVRAQVGEPTATRVSEESPSEETSDVPKSVPKDGLKPTSR